VVLRQESRRIIENTEQVLDDTGEIRLATTQPLEDMDVIKSQVALKDILEEVEQIKVLISHQDAGDKSSRQDVMRRYLDSLTDYGESEIGGESPQDNDSAQVGDLTPRLNSLVLDPLGDPIDIQDNDFDHQTYPRGPVPEFPHVDDEIQSTTKPSNYFRSSGCQITNKKVFLILKTVFRVRSHH
jgi:hypothetical protein